MADSIFTSQTPVNGNANDAVPYALGTVFTADAIGNVSGIRWYFPTVLPGGTVTAALYLWTSDTVGTQLGLTSFAAPVAGTWNVATFGAPIAIAAATRYVAVIWTPDHYVVTSAFFTVAVVNGHLTAIADDAVTPAHNGKFDDLHGANLGIIYPQQFFNSNCYFVDVVVDFGAQDGAIELAQEHDTTFPFDVSSTIDGTIVLAEEHDTAFPFDVSSTVDGAIVLAEEHDTAFAFTVTSTVDGAIVLAEEHDTAFPFVATAAADGTIELAVEHDTAFTFTPGGSGGESSVAPCSWTIPDPLCCPQWEAATAPQKTAAIDFATTILWSSTGRRFGECEITVRPCSPKQCVDGTLTWWGGMWSGSTWIPYIWNGTWFNCGCGGTCSCDPRCQVRLPGPVSTIVEVTIGGVVVPADAYRVDDGHWLVRTDGDCWPQCPDMDTDDGADIFEVTYTRGTPVPPALLMAGAILACEWVKACAGASCRLTGNVQSIARNGIEIQMMDPTELLKFGWTGIREVDMLIKAYNPAGLPYRLRVLSPDLRNPRTTTFP